MCRNIINDRLLFIKKTQKTPRKEIELAKKYRADYLKRKGIDDNDKQL